MPNGFLMKNNNVAIIGLGYVGLPLAINLSKYYNVHGFDVSEKRLNDLKNNVDTNYEISKSELKKSKINFYNISINKSFNIETFIITVPTPVDKKNKPNIKSLLNACKFVSQNIKEKHLIIIESTVAPGTTENQCLNLISKISKIPKKNINICFSPERINPGDKKNQLKDIKKIVSGNSLSSLNNAVKIYKKITKKVVLANSIKSAEFAKIVENSQRDINISFMNEIYKICDIYNLNYKHVLELCRTKWNFVNFKPGLVGGHCVPVDPYYLIDDLLKKGYKPKLLSCARSINEDFVNFVSKKIFKILKLEKKKRILFCGVNFKDNVADKRNSKFFLLYKKISKKYNSTVCLDEEKDFAKIQDYIDLKYLNKFDIFVFGSQSKFTKKIIKLIKNKVKTKKLIINIFGNLNLISNKIRVINI